MFTFYQGAYGETGEILTRSDLVMKGYWRNPEATNRALKNGWLHTGDMGYMDEKGQLFIMDRSKDMIISGGENIYPREIEEVLIRHDAVREVAVIGIPDDKWGVAVVGAGMSKFGMFRDKDSKDLFADAYLEMIASVDKGVDPQDMDALYFTVEQRGYNKFYRSSS